MAYCRLGHIKESKVGIKSQGLKNVLNYIFNPLKTKNQKYVGGYNIVINSIGGIEDNCYTQMMLTKKNFNKEDGRQAYHYKLSFAADDDVSPELALKITHEFCGKCFKDYECAYSVHDNTKHIHSHIVINSIDMIQGLKYHYKKGDWAKQIQPVANELCKKYGISEIGLDLDEKLRLEHKCKNYNKWLKNNNKPKTRISYNNAMIRADVDECIHAATTFDDFVESLKSKGHIVECNRKYISVLAPGRQRPCRLYSLTPDKSTYTEDNIKAMINGSFASREEVRAKLFEEWNKYNKEGIRKYVTKLSKDMAKWIEEKDYMDKHNLWTKTDTDAYLTYLDKADRELNILKQYVSKSLDSRSEAFEKLDTILSCFEDFKNYKITNNSIFKRNYDKVTEAFLYLSERGYDLEQLYIYRNLGNRLNSNINDYKKHIFVEKRICKRILLKQKNYKNYKN